MSEDRTIQGMTPKQVVEMTGDDLENLVDARVKSTLEQLAQGGSVSAGPAKPSVAADAAKKFSGAIAWVICGVLTLIQTGVVWTSKKVAEKATAEWGVFKEGAHLGKRFAWATVTYGVLMGSLGMAGVAAHKAHPDAVAWIIGAFKALLLI